MTVVSPLMQQGTVNQYVASKPTVRVADAAGQPVAGASVIFSVAGADGATVVTATDGTASADWRLSQTAGTQTMVARLYSAKLVSLGPQVSFTALGLADTLAGIAVYSFPPQLGFPSSAVATMPVIVAVDEYLNWKPGVQVRFEVTGGGVVSPAMVTTDSLGRATAGTWVLGSEFGTDTLIARVPNFPAVQVTVGVERPFVVSSIVTGYQHSCAISNGDVYCWGGNSTGQANPTGPTQAFVRPQKVQLGVKAVSLASGYSHTCAISNENPPQAYCWGDNSNGQLGVATAGRGPARVPVADGLSSVTTGASHSCGLTPSGAAYCWGNGSDGQLGNGNILPCMIGNDVATNCPGPSAVAGDLRFTSIAAGAFHTCGLAANGQMDCWGLNTSGQLGSVTTTPCYESDYYYGYYNTYAVPCALAPQAVSGAPPFAAAAAGYTSTCGLTMGGSVECFGGFGRAQLSGTRTFTALSSDGACGVGADGQALCWFPSGFDAMLASLQQPALLDAGTAFTAITMAQRHRCAILKSNSAAVCWGNNDLGQLGNALTDGSVPVPVALPQPPSNP
jgi:alpha-tubulin suppressor-like RCC1 family protein